MQIEYFIDPARDREILRQIRYRRKMLRRASLAIILGFAALACAVASLVIHAP